MRLNLPLSRDEIRSGISEYESLVDYIERRRRVARMAGILQLPKLPNRLTECFVGELIGDATLLSHLGVTSVSAGGLADLVVRVPTGELKVEVKGTAQSFTMFSQKDLDAEYLVWVDLGVGFRANREIGLHVVNHLGRLGIVRDTKMTLPQFLKRTTPVCNSSTYDWSRF